MKRKFPYKTALIIAAYIALLIYAAHEIHG